MRRCTLINPPLENPLELMSGPAKLKLLFRYFPMLPVIFGWKNLKLADYLAGYRNPFLREALLAATGDGRLSALVLVMVLALRSGKNAGYVAGGSRGLFDGHCRPLCPPRRRPAIEHPGGGGDG